MIRRDKLEIERCSDIDEFIRRAQRWSPLYARLLNTLARLPQDVYSFTVENVSFHAGQSQTIEIKELTKPCMIIIKRTDSESLIAHEIAHAYLGHAKKNGITQNIEEEAEQLRKRWGFKKKEVCPSYPRWCHQCYNPHCSESQAGKRCK